MKTQSYGPEREAEGRVPDDVVFWSRFPDVVGLWTVLGWEPEPEALPCD